MTDFRNGRNVYADHAAGRAAATTTKVAAVRSSASDRDIEFLNIAEERVAKAKAARNAIEQRSADGPLSDVDKERLTSAKSDLDAAERGLEAVATRINSEAMAREARARLNIPDMPLTDESRRPTNEFRQLMAGQIDSDAVIIETRDLATDSATGGAATIQTTVANQFFEQLGRRSGIFGIAGKWPTGADVSPIVLPRLTDVGEGDEELPEGDPITEDDLVVDGVEFGHYRYTALEKISNDLAASATVPAEQMIRRALARRLSDKYGSRLATGDGVDKPKGLTVVATPAVAAAAQTTVTQQELLELVHSISPENLDARVSSFVMHPATWQAIRQLEDGDGRLLIGDLARGDGQTLLGYPVVQDRYMPLPEAGNVAICFGAIAETFMIRHTNLRIDRSGHYRFNHDQDTWRAVMGLDTNILDADTILSLTMAA